MLTCPTCGGEVDGDFLTVDLNTNIAAIEGRQAKLSPQETSLLYALREVYPGTLMYHRCYSAVWGIADNEPDYNVDNIVKVLICTLRKKIRPVQIENIWGEGYRIAAQSRESFDTRGPRRKGITT